MSADRLPAGLRGECERDLDPLEAAPLYSRPSVPTPVRALPEAEYPAPVDGASDSPLRGPTRL